MYVMGHAEYEVDILNEDGRVIGQKQRQAIDKGTDIFHSVHVILVTPEGEVIVSIIPAREDLPNLYAGKIGTTMATIRRHGESPEQAARRGLRRELLIEEPVLQPVHDAMVVLEDGRIHHLTAYVVEAVKPELYRPLDIGELMVLPPESLEVALMMNADQFAPTLKVVWDNVRRREDGA